MKHTEKWNNSAGRRRMFKAFFPEEDRGERADSSLRWFWA